MDGVLLFSDYLSTDRDAVHSSLLELFLTSLGEKMTNNNADHGIAILTHRYVVPYCQLMLVCV